MGECASTCSSLIEDDNKQLLLSYEQKKKINSNIVNSNLNNNNTNNNTNLTNRSEKIKSYNEEKKTTIIVEEAPEDNHNNNLNINIIDYLNENNIEKFDNNHYYENNNLDINKFKINQNDNNENNDNNDNNENNDNNDNNNNNDDKNNFEANNNNIIFDNNDNNDNDNNIIFDNNNNKNNDDNDDIKNNNENKNINHQQKLNILKSNNISNNKENEQNYNILNDNDDIIAKKLKTVNIHNITNQKMLNNSNLSIDTNSPRASVYRRRNKRTSTLVEKSRNDPNSLYKDELNISISSRLFINEVRELPNKKYKILNRIGEGSYGTVFLTQNILTKGNFAMKKIEKDSEDLLLDNEIMDEIEILKKLDHPYLVNILEFYNTSSSYYIINDYCPYGELYNQITNKFSETQISVIFRQIFSGLAYLHANDIIHRDLKLENILISDKEKIKNKINNKTEEYFNIKIIDFGTAKIFDKNHHPRAVVGSAYYIAPEVLKRNYNEKCDMWSAGVILYMMIVGHAPFDGATDDDILNAIKKGEFRKNEERWIKSSNEVKDLICKLLLVDCDKRISALDALHHPWFNKMNSKVINTNIPEKKIENFISNLLSYSIDSKLQEMVLTYIIHNMSKPKDTKYAVKLFFNFNKNGDGKLNKKELKEALINYNVTDDLLGNFDDIFTNLDGDRDNVIEFEEFLRGVLDKKEILTDDVLNYAFNFFDKDNSGFIKVENIKEYFLGTHINEEIFNNIFNEIDNNHDGKIDFNEFKNMMTFA